MTLLDEIQSTVSTLAERAGPAIVGIGRHQRGSGVVIGGGRVLTNAHNVRGDEVTVTFADGRRARGTVAGVDADGDLAVIAVETGDVEALEWASGGAPAIGAAVFGAAAANGAGTRITFGLVSAVARAFRGPGGRRIAGSIEHTAPLAPGSSGGAVLDAAGRLVGINTNRIGDGFYLALPADAVLRERVEALGRGEAPSRLRLGVAVAPSHVARRLRRSVGLPDRAGVLVRDVEEGSLAAAADIRGGDLIVAVGGRETADADDLFDALGEATAPFDVTVVRGADELTVTVGQARSQRVN